MGFEPTTPTLARLCSTPELRPHSDLVRGGSAPALVAQYMNHAETDCNTELEEIFLAVSLWTSHAGCGEKPLVSAALSP